jgi:hypothetical protein
MLARPYVSQAGVEFTKLFAPNKADNRPRLLKSFTFALNYETQNFFARSQTFGAINNSNSLVDYYAYLSNYYGGQATLEGALMQSVGLMAQNADSSFSSNVHAPVQQNGDIETRGSTSKIDVAFGGNISDKVYFGFNLAIPILQYTMTESMTETNRNDTITSFQNYNISSTYTESGIGFTGDLGLIYRPFNFIRFGIAYHLPTWYAVTENYSSQIAANFDSSGLGPVQYTNSAPSVPSPDHFSVRTPMKGTLSMSYFIKQSAFFSVDYEFQNLKKTYFATNDPNFPTGYLDTVNAYNKEIYHFSHTVRFGVEGAIKIVRIRAGYSFTNSPYQSGQVPSTAKGTSNNVSFGLGIRLKNFYADLAYVASFTRDINSSDSSSSFVLNSLLYTNQVNNKYITHNVLLTLGWKFNNKESSAPKRHPQHVAPPPVDTDEKY